MARVIGLGIRIQNHYVRWTAAMNFEALVLEDGGFVSSTNCIEKKFNSFNKILTAELLEEALAYQYLVEADGGQVSSVSCIRAKFAEVDSTTI